MKHTTTVINMAAYIYSETGVKPEVTPINDHMCEFCFDSEKKSYAEIAELTSGFYRSPIYNFLDKREKIIKEAKQLLTK